MMPGLTSFQIKLLATLLMVIDHAGRLLFDDAIVMLGLGRLSFPMFAWLATQGEKHTQNFRNYLIRLLVAGAIAQPIYCYFIFLMRNQHKLSWIFEWENWQWNMLFALAYGVTIIHYCKRQEDRTIQFLLVSFCAIGAQFLHLEGGYVTTMSIYAMSLLEAAPILGIGLFSAVHLLYGFNLELLAIVGALICLLYNGTQGPKAKWFYSVYPVHFVILVLLKVYADPAVLTQLAGHGMELVHYFWRS